MIAALVAAILFYILPIATGRLVMGAKKHSLPLLLQLPVYFSAGALVLYGLLLAVGMSVDAINPTLLTAETFRVGLLVLVGCIGIGTILTKPKITISKEGVGTVCGVMLLTIIVYGLWRINSPYAMPLNWDINEHQTLTNVIVQGKIHFQTSKLSDTFLFDGYTTLFHTLLAIPQALVRPDPLGFWWMVEFMHLATTIAASYILGKVIGKSRWVGWISAVIGAFAFESVVAYTSLFLLPQTVAATLGAFTLAYLVWSMDQKRKPISVLWNILALIVLHYIIGAASIALLVGFFLLTKLHQSHRIAGLVLKTLGVVLLILSGVQFLSTVVDFRTVNFGEATMFWHSLTQKIGFAQSVYGNALFLLFPLGAIAAFYDKEENGISLVLLSFMLWAVILAPMPYALKFYTVNRYVVHAIMALGFYAIVREMKFSLPRILVGVIGTMTLVVIFVLNAAQWKDPSLFLGLSTQISPDEQAAATFLHTKNKRDTMVISDPATQYILETVSGMNSQGGAYMQPDTRKTLANVLLAPTPGTLMALPSRITDGILPEHPKTAYVVVNSRTLRWIGMPEKERLHFGINVWSPSMLSLNDIERLTAWETHTGATPIYENASLRIYEVRQKEATL